MPKKKTIARLHLQSRLRSRLKQARLDAELSRAAVCRAIGISPSALTGAETGRIHLKAIDLFLLAELYGRPLAFFFSDDVELAAQDAPPEPDEPSGAGEPAEAPSSEEPAPVLLPEPSPAPRRRQRDRRLR